MADPQTGVPFGFVVQLENAAAPGYFLVNPTILAGDVTVSKDRGAYTPIDTLPTVLPVGSDSVYVELSGAEMTVDDEVDVRFHQVTGTDWFDLSVTVRPTLVTIEDAAQATDVATLLTRLSAARAGYLDWLNIGGLVASQTDVQSIQNNTDCVRAVPQVIERPDAGTVVYRIELALYDETGAMEVPDAAPTLALVNQSGTDLSARLDATTMTLVSTGRYRSLYTASVGDTLEQLIWAFSVVEGGQTRVFLNTSLLVDSTAVDFTAADRTKLQALFGKLPSANFFTGTPNASGAVAMNLATGNFPGSVASVVGTVTLSSGERTALVNALLDLADSIETGLSFRACHRYMAAILGGLASGFPTSLASFSSADIVDDQVQGTKTRVEAVTDEHGNRTLITVDLT